MSHLGAGADGLTHAEFEELVGAKVAASVLFYLAPDRLWFRIGNIWYRGSE